MRPRWFLITCISLALFIGGALRQADLVNANMESADQSAYMDYAKGLRTSHFQYLGDRNRMPVYPGLMALFYRSGMSDDEFFDVGKRVGIGIAIVVLAASFLVLVWYVRAFEAFTLIHVAAFTVFVYKAPYFQADILYYGLAFVLFVLMVEMLLRPHLSVAVATGLIAGFAHLTKASVLPGFILCTLCLLLRECVGTAEVAARVGLSVNERKRIWPRKPPPVLYAGVSVVVFMLVVFPYIRTSKARFGHYFYNVNSTFYMWCDSWAEAAAGVRAHGDRDGWPDMPPDKIPSLSKYLHEHSSQQIAARFINGADVLRKAVARSYGYAPLVLIYLAFATLLLCQNREHFLPLVRNKTTVVLMFFLVSYFAVYLALYTWYTPIVSGNRLILGLFLPAMFCLVWVIDYATRRGLSLSIGGRSILASSASPFVLIALAAYVLLIFPDQISRMSGGH